MYSFLTFFIYKTISRLLSSLLPLLLPVSYGPLDPD